MNSNKILDLLYTEGFAESTYSRFSVPSTVDLKRILDPIKTYNDVILKDQNKDLSITMYRASILINVYEDGDNVAAWHEELDLTRSSQRDFERMVCQLCESGSKFCMYKYAKNDDKINVASF